MSGILLDPKEEDGKKSHPYLIEVNNLNVGFQTDTGMQTALNDVSFKINRGETVGIVGESGSGKTVSALSMMRLLPYPHGKVNRGEMLFDSRQFGRVNLLELSNKQMKMIRGSEISMVFQEPMTSLNPVYTCGYQVTETIITHENISRKQAEERTLELFAKVRFPDPKRIFKSYPHDISGGQKQRVMIAMALACNPSLLVADEPTTALDVSVQMAVIDILRDLRDVQNTSVLFITHDLGLVAEIADRLIVMYQGEIVEQGSIWDIFNKPQHPYTKGLLACRPRLDLKLKVLPVVSDFMQTDSHNGTKVISEGKFNSVGQALMLNYQSETELREKHTKLLQNPPLLQVKNLYKTFPVKKGWFGKIDEYVHAVDDVTFDVYPGETLGLVGESGCGKTTLGRSIIRLVEPTSGQIIYNGKDLLSIPPKEMRSLRKEIQIIFQDPYASLNPRMTIGETIMEPMRLHNVYDTDRQRREYVVELLETVNLSAAHFNRYPNEFSGGQRQRVSIARTLAVSPKFIICDESVSALDVSVQAQVLNLLNKLKEKFNFTYIFISHNLAVVKFISDRIMVMNKGKIEEIGFSEDIYTKPQSAYTQRLIDAIPRGDAESIRRAMLKRKLLKQKI